MVRLIKELSSGQDAGTGIFLISSLSAIVSSGKRRIKDPSSVITSVLNDELFLLVSFCPLKHFHRKDLNTLLCSLMLY